MTLADMQVHRLQSLHMDASADLLQHLKANPFCLAPMAGITDLSFRTVMREMGCGPVITELVSAHGIEYKSPRTASLMAIASVQKPVGIQLFGETPEILGKGAKVVEEAGADFVDLNFGCPVSKVVKKGAGSAILRDLPQVERVFRAVRASTTLPVTVKIRTGWDENSRNAAKVAEIAYNEGLTWVAIHGRTRAAAYTGLADWDFIADVKAKSKIAIIGNGDILSAEMAVQRLRETGCDGVMIGRGCLKNPWIFRQARALWNDGVAATTPEVVHDFQGLFHRLHSAFVNATDQRIAMLQIKKFASWYSSGYPGASIFRKAIFQTQTVEETMAMTLGFFDELREVMQADTSQEAFLMGGHG
jgi:nifR3 family TIM-barrel protein